MTQSLLDQHFFDEVFGISNASEQEEAINLEERLFEKLCKKKLSELEFVPSEIVSINKFISIVDKINNRYPFLYLPFFLKDFIEGEYSGELLKKFHLWSYLGLNYIIENILKFSGKRTKKYVKESLSINLNNEGWEKNYNFFIKSSQIFSEELMELLNHNILNAVVICYLLNEPVPTKGHLLQNVEDLCKVYGQKIILLQESAIRESFFNYIKDDVESKIQEILQNLYFCKYIRFESVEGITLYSKYSNIVPSILEILGQFPEGIPYDNFRRRLLKENNLLRLVPKMGLWEETLDPLEKDNKIVRIRAFWRYSPYRDQLFTLDNFEKKREELRQQVAATGMTKFFGRKITPEKFMRELEQLDKGNLDDKDDHVTRIAGMVLASSTLPQTPKEELDIFDFVTDISDYKFSPEQIKAMNKINFEITGKIIHVKVMLNEKVDLTLIENIRKKLLVDHQAIIFTFKEIPKNVTRNLPDDKSIQILGKDAILAWAEITPEIPCRVNAMAKVMYGPLRGKIVRVNTIEYASGFASVLAISNSEESTVPIGSLTEIWISNCNVREYDEFAKNYEEFLHTLRYCSDAEIFDKGLADTTIGKIKYVVSYLDIQQNNEHVELNPSEEISVFIPKTGVKVWNLPSNVEWSFKFDDVHTRILYDVNSGDTVYRANNVNYDLRRHFKCSCYYWEGVTNSFKFCNHMIAALDLMARKMDCLNHTWKNESVNVVSKLLHIFLTLNNLSVIDAIAFSFSSSEVEEFLSYLKNLPCVDCSSQDNHPSRINLDDLKRKFLARFRDDLQLENQFSRIEGIVKHMKKDTILMIANNIKTEFDEQDWRARQKEVLGKL